MSFSLFIIEPIHYSTHIDTYKDHFNLLWSLCQTIF